MWKLNAYIIETDPTGDYDQFFTFNSLEFGAEYVDTVKLRGYHRG